MLANSQYARPVQVPIHGSYVSYAPVASVGASQLSFWSVLFSKWVIIIVVAVAGGLIVIGIAVGIAVPLSLQSTSKSGNSGSQSTSGGSNNNTSEVYTIVFNVSSDSNISVTVGQITNSADLTSLQQQLDDITASYTSQLSPCSLQLMYAEGTSDGRIITVDSLACTASCTGTCATQKSDSLIQILQDNGQTFATDSSSTVSSMRRRLARSALLNEQNEKVAPGTIIDGRRVAEINGIVTSVSFYTDQSCIGHSIEFGAFEINSYEGSYAEFTAVAGSGPLFVNTTDFSSSSTANNKLKLIVISLCANNDEDVLNDRNCQGVQFPIKSQEYFGSFSTNCSLGSVTLKNVDNTHTYVNRNSGNAFNEPIRQLHYTSLGKQDVWQIPMIIPLNVNNRRQRRQQQQKQAIGSPPRVIFLGTYLPRICGLATFLHDIVVNYDKQFHTNSSIIAIDESGAPIDRVYPNRVIARLNQTEHDSYLNIAKLINELDNVDVLNIQHEYGLFHGQAGEWILHLIAAVKKPVVVTFHTVLQNPESIYYSITRAICSSASGIIVLSHAAHDLLIKSYQIDISKVHVVPHGIPDVPFVETLPSKRQVDFGNRVTVATFGLIGRSKGLEYAIRTMKLAVKQVPDLLYIILGVTHPLVIKQMGEEYRNELQKLINNLNLTHNVKLINKYLDHKELLTYLSAVDIYLTPYSNYNQVVSGTLSIAIGCGKAVVSTPYIYAKELLAHGRGFLIPFKDDTAASQTIVKLATDTDMRDTVRRRAYKYGRKMIWSRVVIQLAHIYENTLFDT